MFFGGPSKALKPQNWGNLFVYDPLLKHHFLRDHPVVNSKKDFSPTTQNSKIEFISVSGCAAEAINLRLSDLLLYLVLSLSDQSPIIYQ